MNQFKNLKHVSFAGLLIGMSSVVFAADPPPSTAPKAPTCPPTCMGPPPGMPGSTAGPGPSGAGGAGGAGLDFGNFPIPRGVSFGLKVGF